MRVLQVDPSLFTPPYDAALTDGLESAGVEVMWAGRPCRVHEESVLKPGHMRELFYRRDPRSAKGAPLLAKLGKAWAHIVGLHALGRYALQSDCDIVHFQWSVLPFLDALAIRRLSRQRPVVFTVHDTSPFNNSPSSQVQKLGFEQVLSAADALIVHTHSAKRAISELVPDRSKVWVIPHGPLGTLTEERERSLPRAGMRWRYLLFGKMQKYKGIDILIEAAGLLTSAQREAVEILIVGEPLIELSPLQRRIEELDVAQCVTFRPGFVSERNVPELLLSADAYVFPYRAIDASGVLHLVLETGRWIVASDLGAFSETIVEGQNGSLVRPEAPRDLADALWAGVGRRAVSTLRDRPTWADIGAKTRDLYCGLLASRRVEV